MKVVLGVYTFLAHQFSVTCFDKFEILFISTLLNWPTSSKTFFFSEEDESEQDLFSAYQSPEVNSQAQKCRRVSENLDVLSICQHNPDKQSITSSADQNKAGQLELTDHDVKCEKPSPVKSPVNNVFAVHDLKSKREKFSLDIEKKPEVIREVKSR